MPIRRRATGWPRLEALLAGSDSLYRPRGAEDQRHWRAAYHPD